MINNLTGNKIKVILINIEEILKKLDDKFSGKLEINFSQGGITKKYIHKELK